MKNLVFLAALLALSLPAAAKDPVAAPRVFDIVPPEGNTVEMVNGYTELRQQGGKFGTLLSFLPETATDAWIPMAVLNTSGGPMTVGPEGLTVTFAGAEHPVWTQDAIVAAAAEADEPQRGRRRPRDAMVNGVDPVSGPDALVINVPRHNGEARARRIERGGSDQTTPRIGQRGAGAAAEGIGGPPTDPLLARLLPGKALAAQEFVRGEVRIDLPPRRTDGQPAEFVLTLDFGGETMDVLYRERLATDLPAHATE